MSRLLFCKKAHCAMQFGYKQQQKEMVQSVSNSLYIMCSREKEAPQCEREHLTPLLKGLITVELGQRQQEGRPTHNLYLRCSYPLRQQFSTIGNFALQRTLGNIWQWFWLSQLGVREMDDAATGIWGVETSEDAKHPATRRPAPHKREPPGPTIDNAEALLCQIPTPIL